MKTIYEFKKGDKIVRVEPAKSIAGGIGDGIRDRSYVGEKMLFHGIANGVIYIKPTQKVTIFISDNGFIDLPLDIWDEGWDYWVEPKTLMKIASQNILLKSKLIKPLMKKIMNWLIV